MKELYGPIIVIIIVFIIAFGFPYLRAWQKAQDYQRGRRKFSALSGKLLKLKDHIGTEADRWPIYARPVMFTHVDHKAQIEFAKA